MIEGLGNALDEPAGPGGWVAAAGAVGGRLSGVPGPQHLAEIAHELRDVPLCVDPGEASRGRVHGRAENVSHGGLIALDFNEPEDVVECEHACRQPENHVNIGAQDGVELPIILRAHLDA